MRSPANIHVTQVRTVLLATDNKNSVLVESAVGKANSIAYSAYGQQSARQEVATGLGFNGQMREAQIGWYLLGNGYRAYNPVLMRFHSPDSWSPFGGGGLNAYMYCVGDPVNASDPTGHIKSKLLKWINGLLGRGKPRYRELPPTPPSPISTPQTPALPLRTEPNPPPNASAAIPYPDPNRRITHQRIPRRTPSPEPTVDFERYMEGQRAMDNTQNVLQRRSTGQSYSLPSSSRRSNNTATGQASNPVRVVPANRPRLATPPPVPERSTRIGILTADDSPLENLAVAQAQLRGGTGK
jgi:RHS repeat-associated protein